MQAGLPSFFTLTPEAFWRGGRLALGAGFGLLLLLVLYLAWAAPEVVPYVPLVLLGATAAFHLFRHPTLNLIVVLAGSVLVVGREPGFQAAEVLYGLHFLCFLAYWFTTRLLVYREEREVLRAPEARALFLFLIGVTLSAGLAPLFGGNFRQVLSEGVALSMLAVYFPVKELCVRHRHGMKIMLLVVGWICLFVAVRNLVNYQAVLLSAVQAWQVTRGRVATNDALLAVPSLLTLVLLIFADGWKVRLALLGAFLLFFSGLVLTQSRGFWLAFLLGAGVMFLVVDRRHKARMLLLGVVGLTGALGAGFLLAPEYMTLIVTGLGERFASLGSAASQDLSLMNRFLESSAAWDRIVQNPVLGHGMGVSYRFYDITFRYTRVDTFIHNGYLALWYKFGVWGLGLMLVAWWASAWHGFQAFRARRAPVLPRLLGLGAFISLVALALAVNSSNPFDHNDTTFLIAVLMGIGTGAYERTREPASPDASPSSAGESP